MSSSSSFGSGSGSLPGNAGSSSGGISRPAVACDPAECLLVVPSAWSVAVPATTAEVSVFCRLYPLGCSSSRFHCSACSMMSSIESPARADSSSVRRCCQVRETVSAGSFTGRLLLLGRGQPGAHRTGIQQRTPTVETTSSCEHRHTNEYGYQDGSAD